MKYKMLIFAAVFLLSMVIYRFGSSARNINGSTNYFGEHINSFSKISVPIESTLIQVNDSVFKVQVYRLGDKNSILYFDTFIRVSKNLIESCYRNNKGEKLTITPFEKKYQIDICNGLIVALSV